MENQDAITVLEDWVWESKSHFVETINIDDGYGAVVWEVVLRNGSKSLRCYEVDNGNYWEEKDGNLICCVPKQDDEIWAGLSRTIIHAVKCAKKLWSKNE